MGGDDARPLARAITVMDGGKLLLVAHGHSGSCRNYRVLEVSIVDST
jgi:hypothetical protein